MIINPQQFITEIPDLHPLSNDYINFWRTSKQRCIEGHWLGGYYMPPGLYFYTNFGTILLNKKRSNVKSIGRPWLRDLEWMFFRAWMEARGFSGFAQDEEYSGNFLLLDPDISDEFLQKYYPSTINSLNQRKEFLHPRTLLEMQHSYHKGAPLYDNEAYNILMLGSRDTGKTYMVGVGIVLHQWLFNGLTSLTEDISDRGIADITVGAELAHYSNNMLTKTKFALENLPGSKTVNGRRYPSPFDQQYRGSWGAGSSIIAEYKSRQEGGWEIRGTRAAIRHRTFRDNPFAEQGTRPITIVVEEAGHCSNLQDIFTNTKDNLRNGLRKTGTLMMLGTGGDMEAGTLDASRMMYEPEAYDILAFPDIWEHKGNIGFFIPAYLALNEYKDEKGFSMIEEARAALLKARQKAKTSASGGSEVLQKEIQYRPIVPSEMFLTKSANIFPVIEARRRLSELQSNNLYELLEKKVNLFFDPSSPYNGINYEIDFNLTPINRFPWTSDDVEGATIIYDFPYLEDGRVPQDAYIIGCDPFRDNTGTEGSFAAIYVMKTNKYPSTVGHNEIVATYVGRPYEGVNKVNEILYKLSLFYGNAKIYFENAVGNVKDYFEKIKRLDLLAKQPVNVLNRKASFNTTESVIYGYPMSNDKIKWEALQYVRSWLLQERENNVRNIDVIPDRFLLQQLISFNLDGNFDGVMGLIGCVIGLEEIYISSKRRAEAESFSSSVDIEFDKLLVNNKRLFYKIDEKFSQTTPIVSREDQKWLSMM